MDDDALPSDRDPDLRPGADSCYKCSTCDTSCPVAAVDEEFSGPKFQGPEQWRLERGDEASGIDDSITHCSNCMRCEAACPAGVPLSQMHNTARAKYVREDQSRFSVRYWRNRLLANYRTIAAVASRFPRLSNALASNRFVRALGERLLGITSERSFPPFATQTFREWWDERERSTVAGARGGDSNTPEDRKIAYFHGCYANFNTPEVARALVRVFEDFGYEVVVPEQRCSGTPMFANGMLPDARRAAEVNVATLSALVEEGYDVVCSCTSCSMALRQEYPELFAFEGTEAVAANTYEALEYLRINEDLSGALAEATADDRTPTDLAYHAPCHARNQGLAGQAPEMLSTIDDLTVTDVGDSCSGMSGTYGWKAEKYDLSMEIGAEMFEHMADVSATTGLTECPTCAMQMEHGTGDNVRHPLEVLAAALVDDESPNIS